MNYLLGLINAQTKSRAEACYGVRSVPMRHMPQCGLSASSPTFASSWNVQLVSGRSQQVLPQVDCRVVASEGVHEGEKGEKWGGRGRKASAESPAERSAQSQVLL